MKKILNKWSQQNFLIKLLTIVLLCLALDTSFILAKMNPILYNIWVFHDSDLTHENSEGIVYHVRPFYYIEQHVSGDTIIEDVRDSESISIGPWFLPSITIQK